MFKWKIGVDMSWQLNQRRSKGFIPLVLLITLGGLFVGIVVIVANIGKSIELRTKAQVIGSNPSDALSSFTWEDCIKIPGSKEMQTYPPICVAPDGRRVTEGTKIVSTTVNSSPITNIVHTVSTFIGNFLGAPAQFLKNLFSSN